MTKDQWQEAALNDEALVANLLLGMKNSLDSDSQKTEPVYAESIPPCWGNRKSRSKFTGPVGKEQRGSPTTHLSWSGGGGGSTSDESCRPSDLSTGFRSKKSNEFASTSSYNNKSHEKKVSVNKQESTPIRVNLNQQMYINQDFKKIKINYGQTARNSISRCRVEAEIEPRERGFVLPDLNMTPNDEDLMMMMMMMS